MSTLMDKKDQNDEKDSDEGSASSTPAPGNKDKTPAKIPSPPRKLPPAVATSGGNDPGFFHIYKKGQGKWTRVGTVLGAALVGAMTCSFIWDETNYRAIGNFTLGYIPSLVFAVLYVLMAYLLMNKPRNVDFLIATDSEMKKVNWTTRAELWGSTKVVILFMFVIAVFLFTVDEMFEIFFYWIHVLKIPPW